MSISTEVDHNDTDDDYYYREKRERESVAGGERSGESGLAVERARLASRFGGHLGKAGRSEVTS